ncbi:T9SS C-terminal target domain-containing protein [Aquimarina sp. BL5]|uniref:carbohydrate-binding protein n=1 Tax=Aquimarina sp. BL5 TaxID=1714860 RepID=UPI000E556372|nr:carbohydrate-binding protein [Aquimarina sp. BL5]AXT49716.1 T9SS C-terminal target domain-containing protein [Aquimarina sp. BL5]RKN04277.1 carbohydrate-binding protein [Aquimarina sp. BL5]
MQAIRPHYLLKINCKKLKRKYQYIILPILIVLLYPTHSINAQTTVVSSLEEFRIAVQNSNQEIVLEAGNYYLEDLPSNSRVINCTGSGNTIDMTGARINTLVGSIREVYFIISGDNNVIRNGAIEDFYRNGLDEVTDFSAYNNDRDNLAYGLRGDPIISITGNQNLVEGLEMIVKGSFPYGYGSQYGIGSQNTFGLSKRCGILVTGIDGGGIGNTLNGITMYHYAFGHGIFMQSGATETTIKNCYIEGRMRLSDDMYNDTETYDLPYLTDYKFPTGDGSWRLPFEESYDIPYNHVYPLSEDGIRSYNNTGSVTVENCTVKQMRGGIRLYLASSATVKNSQAIDCGSGGTNYNMPAGGTITGSSGNFTYAPLSDFRLSRSRQNIEMTIIPSPNAIGPHNIADILGNNHNIIFHRTPGPLDTDETRAIVITGDNSTIVNETEYRIILESSASGNTIISCGPVSDNGDNNDITYADDCYDIVPSCDSQDAFTQIEAEDFCDMLGVQITGDAVGYIEDGDWIKFEGIDFRSGATSISALVSSGNSGGNIEIRQTSITGNLLGTLEVPNTGSWTSWETVSTNISLVTGVQDIYFVFTGDPGYLLDIDSFNFSEETLLSVNDNKLLTPSLYPNPVVNTITIERAADSVISIYDVNGKEVYSATIANNTETIDLSNLPTGLYYAKVLSQKDKTILKIIKK